MYHRNNFDLIRLLAATQVVYSHATNWLELPLPPAIIDSAIMMFRGVPVFFIVSGFLISGSFINSDRSIFSYLKSRVLRIYPALWVNILVIICMLGIAGNLRYFPNTQEFWSWLAVAMPLGSDFFASQIVGPVAVKTSSGFYDVFPSGVLWTIPIELGFYVLVLLIFPRCLRDRGLLGYSLAFWGTTSLVTFILWGATSRPYQIPQYLWFFLMGAAIQVYRARIIPLLKNHALIWLTIFLGTGALFAILGDHTFAYQNASIEDIVLDILLALTVISCAFTLPNLSKVLRGTDISYGIYLWHMPVIWTFVGFGLTGNWAYAIIALLIVASVSVASWFLIEKPALALKNSSMQNLFSKDERHATYHDA